MLDAKSTKKLAPVAVALCMPPKAAARSALPAAVKEEPETAVLSVPTTEARSRLPGKLGVPPLAAMSPGPTTEARSTLPPRWRPCCWGRRRRRS